MVTSMIALAHSMNITVVAEGIEREEELTKLVASGCDYVQGYLTGHPGSLASLAARFGLREDIDGTTGPQAGPTVNLRGMLPKPSGPNLHVAGGSDHTAA